MRTLAVRMLAVLAIFACCLFLGTTCAAQSAPFGYLDWATGADTSTNIPYSGSLYVWGWAGDYQDFAPVARVQVFIDGAFVTNATLNGSRPDVANVFGPAYANSGYTAIIPLSKYAAGSHQVTAFATNSAGLTAQLVGEKTFVVLAPNVGVSSLSVTGTLAAGATVQATEVTTNSGSYQAPASYTRFYLNKTATKGGFQLTGQFIPALAINASSTAQTSNVVLPANLSGQYYLLACANDNGAVVDTNTSNDCASTVLDLAGPDLAQSVAISASTAAAGKTIQITDTVRNVGAGAAGYSLTRYYLNTTAVKGGYQIGSGRQVPALAANAVSGPVTATVALPNNISGSYFVLACANDVNGVPDMNTSNDCASSPITLSGPDLAESTYYTSTAAPSGSVFTITDTVRNIGSGTAGPTLTRYWLNTTTTRGGFQLGGGRTVPALASGASSGPIATNVILPKITGDFYIVSCANDVNSFVENTANNCISAPISLYNAADTVIVNPKAVGAIDDPANCGSETAPCMTINEGVAAAKPGQAVLVSPGSYEEQINITKNLRLISASRERAFIGSPRNTPLVADGEGLKSLITISGGATAVSVNDFVITASWTGEPCSEKMNGITVKNANATISGNLIEFICRSGTGIQFGSRDFGYVGHSGIVARNQISGDQAAGVVLDGVNTTINLTGNIISNSTSRDPKQFGVQISNGARGALEENHISGACIQDAFAIKNCAGILLVDAGLNVTLTNNSVSGFDEGIGIYHTPAYLPGGTAPDFNQQFTVGAVIKNNFVAANHFHNIHVDPFSKGCTIWNNDARGSVFGFDELDEHPDFSYNDWGADPSQYNLVWRVHSGLLYSY